MRQQVRASIQGGALQALDGFMGHFPHGGVEKECCGRIALYAATKTVARI
jgi:hypothetical protein